jgi:lipid-binding SYLF domain-containing protein
MKTRRTLSTVLVALVLVHAVAVPALARDEEGTVRAAQEVLGQFLDLRVKDIPAALLSEAHGVAIIPGVIKVGLVVGGQHGRGVVAIRQRDGSWKGPIFITLTGGSIGWQAGAQSTDFVLVFKTQKSVDGMLNGKFTLGADAAVAAGPVGRRAEAATDVELKAEIYSYSRSRGLFAGVSLDGSVLQVDDVSNVSYYGVAAPGSAPPPAPESAQKLIETIARLTANPAAVVTGASAELPIQAAGPTVQKPELDALQAEIVRNYSTFSPLVDDAWRRYLALPGEFFEKGRHPSADSVNATLHRFDSVAQNPQYKTLAQRPEFQSLHGLLRGYSETLTNSRPAPHLALPPPPGASVR